MKRTGLLEQKRMCTSYRNYYRVDPYRLAELIGEGMLGQLIPCRQDPGEHRDKRMDNDVQSNYEKSPGSAGQEKEDRVW